MPEDPGWTFTVREISAGVYRVEGRDLAGRRFLSTGEDPEKLLQDAREWLAENADSVLTRPDRVEGAMAMLQLKCPETGEVVDVQEVSPRIALLRRHNLALWVRRIPCPYCGDTHPWSSGDEVRAMETLADSPDATRVLVDGESTLALP